VQSLEALAFALKHTQSASILFDQGQQWRCTSLASLSIPSCSSADDQAKLFFVTSENKPNNFPNTSQSRCSHFDLLEQSQTLHRVWSLTTIPSNATITTIPRGDSVLAATSADGCSYQRSCFSTDPSTMQKQLMEEAPSYQSLKALREGKVEITFNSKHNPLMHILSIFF
jgi:hypothetical protein